MVANNEKVYNEEISPLMAQILEICKAKKIPMAAIFQYVGDDHELGAGHCSSRIEVRGQSGQMTEAIRAVSPIRPVSLATFTYRIKVPVTLTPNLTD